MKTRILPLAALAAVLSGCVQENHASIEFFAVCFPPEPDTTTGACSYGNTCELVLGGTFWADVSAVTEAVALIQLNNQLPNNEDLSVGRVNTNDAFIQQFRFEFVGTGLPEVWVDANVTVPASSSQLAFVPVLPPNIVPLLAGGSGHLVVSVRAAGRYLDERTFETGPYKVPVDFCSGCFAPPTCASGFYFVCIQPGQSGNYVCAT